MYSAERLCTVINLPIQLIVANPYQPRKYFDQNELEDLASSIREYGVIQPITVRRAEVGYELVSGERRLRASTMARMESIPAIVVDVDNEDSAIISLIENLQRRDLTFFEEAEGYAKLIEEHKLTQEELAFKMGKTQSTIANKLRLLKFPQDLRTLILENQLSERHARALLKVTDYEMQRKILKIICEKKLNVLKTEELIERELNNYKENIRFQTFREHRRRENKDLRIFYNTINQAIKMVNKLGVETRSSQIEHDDYVEFIIRIDK